MTVPTQLVLAHRTRGHRIPHAQGRAKKSSEGLQSPAISLCLCFPICEKGGAVPGFSFPQPRFHLHFTNGKSKAEKNHMPNRSPRAPMKACVMVSQCREHPANLGARDRAAVLPEPW